MDWRDKDDSNLTTEDIAAMITEGKPVVTALLPGGAVLVLPALTFGGSVTHWLQ